MEQRERYEELCRLCASYDAVKMDLFGQEGKNRQLVDKIQACMPFKIAENDRLPKCLCYRCMYNLENFYDFRTACVNAVALLERCLPQDKDKNDERRNPSEHYSELRSELLKEKQNMPILIPEAPVVNPNAALGTPPRFNSDGEADNDIEEVLEQSGTEEGADDMEDRKSEEYEMDMETNPSDFLEMTPMVTEDNEENERAIAAARVHDSRPLQHKSEQHEVYVCSLCNKAFSSKGHLSLHARIHVGAGDVIGEKVITDDHTSYKRPYQCDLCYKAYSTAKHRWGHVSTTHRGHPAVTCSYCSRIYSTRGNLEEHIRSRHAGLPLPPELPLSYVQPENKYQCKTCPKMYTNTTDLNKHSRVCTGVQQKELINNLTIEKLKKSHIDTSDMSSNESTDESKDYKNAEAKLAKNPQLTILKQALTKGDNLKRSYDEKYKTSSKTKKQTGIENSETDVQRRWFCETCSQSFNSLESFKEHELTHETEKPYFCLLCEKDFTQKTALGNHIVTIHGVDPNPILESDRCLKKTQGWNKRQESNGKSNLIIKREESPISCPEIVLKKEAEEEEEEEEEEQQQQINNKMIEIETVFVCEICTRDFNDRASLWLHIRATHKEFAAFACGVCLKICSDNAQLLNHVNMYHGGSKLLMSEQRRYSCTICGRQHDSRKKLITHVSIHNVDPSYDPGSFVQLNSNYYNENLNSNEGNEHIVDGEVEDGEKVDCYICYKSFPNEDHLIRHQRNAHKSDPAVAIGESTANGNGSGSNTNGNRAQYHLFFICELCGSSYPSKWERWLHVSSVHANESSIKCEREDCAKIFATKSLRNEHVQHHMIQGSSPNTCEICGKLWGSRVDYWKHVMGVHSDTVPLICGVCLKVFPNVLQLSSHVKAKHWPLTNGDFSCDICGRPYSNKSKMSRHRKIHGLDGDGHANPDPSEYMNDTGRLENGGSTEVDFSCEMCGDLKFMTLEDLCNHRRMTHSLFPCDLCNKCYGRTSHLWKHVNRVHKGHEDVTCRFCLKTSASRDHLSAHIAKIHRYEPEVKNSVRESINFKVTVPEDEILHHCEKCNKGFHKRYLLRRHMKGCQNYRKDPGALLTRCRACERIFKDRASLQKHIENHHSSYTCHLCNETITSKLAIMTHNRVHHMNHPDLTCDYSSCKKLFRTKEDLESHKKDHRYHTSPNVCDFCGDTVENKLKLKMHVLSLHRNEIGVSCGVCLIPMKDPKDLKKHVEDCHKQILLKPNTCQVCGKQYASKWKAFDHTKKCHGKVFKTCKQCLAVFITEEDMKNHYEHIHNVPKDQLATYEYRLEIGRKRHYDSLEIVMKEEPEELEFGEEPIEDYSMDYKRRISESDYDYDTRGYIREFNDPEVTNPAKKRKLDLKGKQKMKDRENYKCKPCKIQFDSKDLLYDHIGVCHNLTTEQKMKYRENFTCKSCNTQFDSKNLYHNHLFICRCLPTGEQVPSFPTSILEAHLKNNNQIKREEHEQDLDENNLNTPDFNLFEDINMQLSGQRPVQNLSIKSSSGNSKCSRKDSRKVYDESTNTECTCEVCGKQWPAKKHLWQHLIRFHRVEAAVTCGVCLKLCKTYEDLANHLKAAHEALLSCEGNNFTCKICGRYHNARSKLLLHMSIHINCKNNPMCNKCKRSFETDEKLKEHVGNCEGRQSGLGIRHDTVKDEKMENDEKGSFIGDETEEKEADSGSEGEEKASDNEESSSDDSEDSETDSSSSSSDDDDDDDDEKDKNEDDDENEVAPGSRTTSRLGELSCTSDSEDEASDNSEGCEEEVKSRVKSEDEKVVMKKEQIENRVIKSKLILSESDTKDSAAFESLNKKSEKMVIDSMDYSDDEGPPVLSPMMPLLPSQEEEITSHIDEMNKLSPMINLENNMEKGTKDSRIDRMNLTESEETESESEDENKMCIFEDNVQQLKQQMDEEEMELQDEIKEEKSSQVEVTQEFIESGEENNDNNDDEDENDDDNDEEDEDDNDNGDEDDDDNNDDDGGEVEEEEERDVSEDENEKFQILDQNSPVAAIEQSEVLSQNFEEENSDEEAEEEAEDEADEEAEDEAEEEAGEEAEEEVELEEAEEELSMENNTELVGELGDNNSLIEEEIIGEENYEEASLDEEMNNEDHSMQNLNKTILTVGKDLEGNPILIREVVTQYVYQDDFDGETDYVEVPQDQNSFFHDEENQRMSEENFALNNVNLDQNIIETNILSGEEIEHDEEIETDKLIESKVDSDTEESRTSAKS